MKDSSLIDHAVAERLLKRITPVDQATSCSEVLDRFSDDLDLHSLPVINEENIPVGLIDRHTLLEIFVRPGQREASGHKPIQAFMDAAPIIVDSGDDAGDLAGLIIDAGMKHMVNGFIITHLGQYIGVGSRKQSHLYYLAHFDQLTGLPNRLLFEDRLQMLCINNKTHPQTFAIILLNIDRFKFINDNYGNAVGNLTLLEFSERLVSCVRKNDTVARFNGDEFALLLNPVDHQDEATRIATKVRRALRKPFSILGDNIAVTATMGVTLGGMNWPTSPDLLIHQADVALSTAKETCRGSYLLYQASMEACKQERLSIEAGLATALEAGEFRLYYQPQCATASGAIVGVEVLMRWVHPGSGHISPARFIPIAEEIGHIIRIGEWVLREACRQQVEWIRQGLPDLRMGVNISPLQIQHPHYDFRKALHAILEETGMDPTCLELELTEGVVMGDTAATLNTLNELRTLGIRLAIDDFGTGYSSLSYLSLFPLDRIKIDRSFIRGIDSTPVNLAIVRTIVSLGKNLGMEVIAEGVETDSEMAALLKEGDCVEVQGFHISGPIPAAEFADWFRSRMANTHV
jgi:diguanylate cyclase (GGDEF)-like protein